jgi:SAM-dependent methyltransferase
MKQRVAALPVVGPVLRGVRSVQRRRAFHGSAPYWESHYAAGGNSGEGSYGGLAQFKADVLNAFVAEQQVTSVLELGCGDGHQLSLATYPRYVGLDVAATAIDLCLQRFASDNTKSFLWYDARRIANHGALTADLAMSLDVLYHLIEDEVFDGYLRLLFGAGERFVAIYSSDIDAGDSHPHVRHRRFTDWVASNASEWTLTHEVANPIEHRDTAARFFFYSRV